jgi:hypothetical protein
MNDKIEKYLSDYQTVQFPSGEVRGGAFDTLKFFEQINLFVRFENKSIIDLGCNNFMYSVLARKMGAKEALGIESNKKWVKGSRLLSKLNGFNDKVVHSKVEDFFYYKRWDVGILAMILHWLEDPAQELRRLAPAIKEDMAIIYREKHDGYQIPENGNWFPTQQELDQVMKSISFRNVSHGILLEQDSKKFVNLAVYKRYKDVIPMGDIVIKRNENLDDEWEKRLSKVLELVDTTAFDSFATGGYATKFIDGIDLYGSRPYKGETKEFILDLRTRENLVDLFKSVVFAGIETGYYLADFTRRNIVVYNHYPYLIEFDEIITEFDQSYIDIYQEMIDFLNIDYKFKGNPKELYEVLKNE